MGEQQYYSMITTLSAIPSDMKAQLNDDFGIDYESISDFELFIILTRNLTVDKTKILFGDIDLSKFIPCKNNLNDEIVLYDEAKDIIIDRLIYQIMIDYIRKMHNITPKVEKAGNAFTKQILLDEARQKLNANSNKPYKSILQPLISAMVNSDGFKYNLQEVKNIGIYEFMDSVQRIQVIRSATCLLTGCYSGNVDTSKISKKELNWLRELKD